MYSKRKQPKRKANRKWHINSEDAIGQTNSTVSPDVWKKGTHRSQVSANTVHQLLWQKPKESLQILEGPLDGLRGLLHEVQTRCKQWHDHDTTKANYEVTRTAAPSQKNFSEAPEASVNRHQTYQSQHPNQKSPQGKPRDVMPARPKRPNLNHPDKLSLIVVLRGKKWLRQTSWINRTRNLNLGSKGTERKGKRDWCS